MSSMKSTSINESNQEIQFLKLKENIENSLTNILTPFFDTKSQIKVVNQCFRGKKSRKYRVDSTINQLEKIEIPLSIFINYLRVLIDAHFGTPAENKTIDVNAILLAMGKPIPEEKPLRRSKSIRDFLNKLILLDSQPRLPLIDDSSKGLKEVIPIWRQLEKHTSISPLQLKKLFKELFSPKFKDSYLDRIYSDNKNI
ncbi:hypothetical protein [Urechidicola vernalis]|uniref:Uncharacterized protein n=1 Tax=Urechidicola vernalis TaxID=3075600 RepID=A0ABU2Y8B0_9FLAO|nr:hypothetical protein [Urechidicola sp. P050]MDT0554040.1 hypothetical protein [Urechidicola sp. P050]